VTVYETSPLPLITGVTVDDIPHLAASHLYRIMRMETGANKHLGDVCYAVVQAVDAGGNPVANSQALRVWFYRISMDGGKYVYLTVRLHSNSYEGKVLLMSDNPDMQGEHTSAYVIYNIPGGNLRITVPSDQF
jgi:hypothetical protein